MSPTPPALNPSQTVERIREIIVGRHLERLEGRVARLESVPAVATPPPDAPIFDDRITITEAKLEALQDHIHRIESHREEDVQVAAMQRQEARRLASQIQEIAREKANAAAIFAVGKLEHKLGIWLTDWQKSLQVRLDDRDQALTRQLREELTLQPQAIDRRVTALEDGLPQDLEKQLAELEARFSKATEKRVARLEGKIPDELDRRFSDMETKTSETIDQRINGLGRKIPEDLNKQLSELSKRIGEYIDKRITRVESKIPENIESRVSGLESRVPQDVEDRFNRIATAARALAECASSLAPTPPREA